MASYPNVFPKSIFSFIFFYIGVVRIYFKIHYFTIYFSFSYNNAFSYIFLTFILVVGSYANIFGTGRLWLSSIIILSPNGYVGLINITYADDTLNYSPVFVFKYSFMCLNAYSPTDNKNKVYFMDFMIV